MSPKKVIGFILLLLMAFSLYLETTKAAGAFLFAYATTLFYKD